MVDLRAYVFLDSLQPQFASYQATISKGYLPTVGQASLFVEIAPGMAINHILDVALKSTDVTAGMQIVERHYGMNCIPTARPMCARPGRPSLMNWVSRRRTGINRVSSPTRWCAISKPPRRC